MGFYTPSRPLLTPPQPAFQDDVRSVALTVEGAMAEVPLDRLAFITQLAQDIGNELGEAIGEGREYNPGVQRLRISDDLSNALNEKVIQFPCMMVGIQLVYIIHSEQERGVLLASKPFGGNLVQRRNSVARVREREQLRAEVAVPDEHRAMHKCFTAIVLELTNGLPQSVALPCLRSAHQPDDTVLSPVNGHEAASTIQW